MYRIAITTIGTRGDVQPYIALARGLIGQEHRVILVAPEQFAGLVAEHGVDFSPLPGDLLALLDTPEGKMAVSKAAGAVSCRYAEPAAVGFIERKMAAVRPLRAVSH